MSELSNVRVPPPVFYVAALLVGYGLDRVAPLPALPGAAGRVTAYVLIGVAFGLLAWCEFGFRRHKTTIHHRAATTALITTGAFAFSRNPIYVGLTLLFVGIALWLDSAWLVGMTFVAAFVVDRYVVRREEAYLERTFGDEYRAYRARVRRWL